MIKGQKNEAFGRLYRGALKAIAAFEGRTEAAIEQEFGDALGVAPATIQRYKQGLIPDLAALEFFAESAVRRGFLDREWLARFLRVALHPDAQRVLDELRPSPQTDRLPPRPRDNLPSPYYTAFVMRPAAFRQVLDGLQQRTAVVAIVSLGGMGKSSLALETAKCCLGASPVPTDLERPSFEAAVWISDKDQLGTTRLSTVLDTIAITLGYPGCTSLDLRQKRGEVDSMLRSRRVLIVLDNFETVSDERLIEWLLRLPEPSKALLTTRHYRTEFQRGVWIVELGGMHPDEAGHLIDQRASQLNLAPIADVAMRERLFTLTGGNPRALELIVSQVKFSHRSFNSLLDGFEAHQNDLLEEIFAYSWDLLTPEARLVLRVAAMFVSSAGIQSLVALTGLPRDDTVQAVQQLFALALAVPVPAMHGDVSRLALHPLTRTFINAHAHTDQPTRAELFRRWIAWCVRFAGEHGGYRIFNVDQLAMLDSEEATLFAATQLAFEQGCNAETIQLAASLEFYYYVRANWSKKLDLHRWWIAAASRSGALADEINALALHIQLLSRQGHHQEADQYMPRLEALIQQQPMQGERAFHYHHTCGHFLLARAQDEPASLQAAASHWQWLLEHPQQFDNLMLLGAQHWLATCLARQGLVEQARTTFEAALRDARTNQVPRFVARNQLGLANLDIQADDRAKATARLDEVRALTTHDDYEQLARLAYAEGCLYTREQDYYEAERQLDHAVSLFARMGLIHDQMEAEQQRAIVKELGQTER